MSKPTREELLAQFPRPVTLTVVGASSLSIAGAAVLAFAAIVVTAVVAIKEGFAGLFFVNGISSSHEKKFLNGQRLVLTSEGLEIQSRTSSLLFRWADIQDFRRYQLGLEDVHRVAVTLALADGETETFVLPTIESISIEDLFWLLREWQIRALPIATSAREQSAAHKHGEEWLAQFPGPVTLQAERGGIAVCLSGFLAVFCIAVLVLIETGSSGFLVVFIVVVSVLSLLLAILLVPGVNCLKLSATALQVTSFGFMRLYLWNEVRRVEARPVDPESGARFAELVFEHRPLPQTVSDRPEKPTEVKLPSSYGMDVRQLAQLVGEWRSLALAQSSSARPGNSSR